MKSYGTNFPKTKHGSAMDEFDYIPLSRLSHAGYCLRRAALLTNEDVWTENADTAKGREEHRNVHNQRIERRGDHINLYDYEVFSDKLEIRGKCDCVEAVRSEDGCKIPAADFPVLLYPVESKHGKLRNEEEYEIQLCAQAMCLEEMYATKIEEGAIFYTSSHRRQPVYFTETLRQKVLYTIEILNRVRKDFVIPPAESGPRCKKCSIRGICLPDLSRSADEYCKRLAREATGEETL